MNSSEINLNTSMRSPLSLRFLSEVSCRTWRRFSYDSDLSPLTSFVALRWTLSRWSMYFLRYGDYDCMACYSKCGL